MANRSYSILHSCLFSWKKNVPMAHIFNDTMDFPTRPGRNAQTGSLRNGFASLYPD